MFIFNICNDFLLFQAETNKTTNNTSLEEKRTVEVSQDLDNNKTQPQIVEIRSEQGSAVGEKL